MTMFDVVTGIPVLYLTMCALAAIPHAARAALRWINPRGQHGAIHMRGPVRR